MTLGGVVELPVDDAARVAEQEIRTRVATFLSRDQLEALLLVTRELVQRAVSQGQPPILLRVALSQHPECVQVSVTESSGAGPAAGRADRAGDDGSGSELLDVPGARWGSDSAEGGATRWWAEVDA